MFLKKFGDNVIGKDYVVGDIHGCFNRLSECLSYVGFNERVDRLFSVGDLVDRGPNNEKVLEWLDKPWFHPVVGNHEELCLEGRHQYSQEQHLWFMNGGEWSKSCSNEFMTEVRERFSKLPTQYRLEGRPVLGLYTQQFLEAIGVS